MFDRKTNGFYQIQIQLLLDQDTQHAKGRTTQGVGVLAASRQHADAEDADQGVQLIGQGHGGTGEGTRQLSTGTARHVLLVQCQGHVFGFAIVFGVVVTGDALHFREFADHLAGQVALTEDAGTRRAGGVTTDALGDKTSQGRDTLGLVIDRTQLGLEHHIGQALVEAFQLLLLVLLEEELGVGEARTHHFLITGNDLRRIFAFDVGHGDKARQQLAVAIEQAEIFLVVLHGGDQRFLRHVEEAFLEGADQRHRPFDQGADFIQQRRRHDGGALLCGSQFIDPGDDLRAAFGEVCNHIGAAQVFGVVGRRADAHLVVGVEAVATGNPAGALGEDFAIDHLVTEQHHQPLAWADKFGLARAPAHTFRDRQLVQRGFDDGRQQAGRSLAWDALAEFQLGAILVDLAQLDATLFGEAQRGLRRVAVLVERCLYGRAVEIDGAVRLLGCELFHQHGQTARRSVIAYVAVAKTSSLEAFLYAGQEGFAEGFQGFRWQLFGAQFYQEITGTHSAASSLASTSSRRSGAASGKPSLRRACR